MKETIRIAAVGDIHCSRTSHGALQPLFAQMADCADIVVLCGDLVDYGYPEEVAVLLEELAPVRNLPIVAVLGNHDFESGSASDVARALADSGMTVLDGDSTEIRGVGFAGVKGFGGGFGRRALEPWGERGIKDFVNEAVQESLKLESALARLQSAHRIAVLHYAPIRETVEGEPLEIFPFLGSSRLEDPINRYQVTAAFHGHAHHGSPEGKTGTGIPVYNVAMPLLREHYPGRPSFRILELSVASAEPLENRRDTAGAITTHL